MHNHRLILPWLVLACVPLLAQEPSAATPETKKPDISASPDLSPDADGKLSQEQIQQLFRVVADKDLENDKKLRDYTYLEYWEEHKLDGAGQTKSIESKTSEVLELYGEQVRRLIEKNHKPLDAKEAAKEEARIQKIVDKHKGESEEEQRKRREKEDKDQAEGREFVREIADAYNFTLTGTEVIDGREAWAIAAEPRPGFVPHVKDAKYLSKFHGRVWIDRADQQLTKMDMECLDTISWGLFLARLHKGTRILLEQTRVNDEVWLPKHVTAKIDARLALLMGINLSVEQSYRDYKKFHTSAKIVGFKELGPPAK